MERRTRVAVSLCFLLSGAAGLIYEVVWGRQLALFLGISTYAHTAVISATMIGLAAGSLAIGRWADRWGDPLRAYAALEVGVGVYAAATPWLFRGLQGAYAATGGAVGVTGPASHLVRFLLALASLLVPTFLMGGTLPLLVRGLTRSLPDLAPVTGRLYGINTLGAALGTFAAGYLLLPALGMRGTVFVGVALNLGVAGAVLALPRRPAAPEPAEPSRPRPVGQKERMAAGKQAVARPAVARPAELHSLAPWAARALLVGFALSGLAALIYELAWIRALNLVIGSSVYAFSATLTTYLAGLALGSLAYARLVAGRAWSLGRQLGAAAGLQAGIGLSAAAGLGLIGLLPGLFLQGFQAGLQDSFPLFQAFIFGLCFLLMIVPTLLLGALFPLVTALWARSGAAVGRGVGMAYAANTAGTILGSLLGGLVLLPVVGVYTSVLVAAGVHVAGGAGFWLLRATVERRARGTGQAPTRASVGLAAAALLAYGLAGWLIPPWDRALMSVGVFHQWEALLSRASTESLSDRARSGKILFYEDGRDGTVVVRDTGEQRILVINGKPDASSRGDLPTQVMLAQLPLLLHPGARDVLVIGLGSGTTAGSVAAHKSVEHLTVLEISPEVVQASAFFAEENHRVLSDPRVDLVVADARNALLADAREYDVISSEPSNPWISGVSNLFTREFFELARSRLAPGGVMTQWFHIYNMSPADLKAVLGTFQSVFPSVTVWEPLLGDLLLVGSESPQSLDLATLRSMLGDTRLREDLARAGVATEADVVHMFLYGGDELAVYTAGASINTDDRPTVEFGAPRSLYADTILGNEIEPVGHLSSASPAPVSAITLSGEPGFSVPGLGLAVQAAGAPASAPSARWLVTRTLVTQAEGAVSGGRVSSQMEVVWREGAASTQLAGLFGSAAPSAQELRALLEAPLAGRLVQGGDITLLGSVPGQWVCARGQAAGQIELGIAWTCPAVGGEPTLLAFSRQPDPGEAGWGLALQAFAGRFRCLP